MECTFAELYELAEKQQLELATDSRRVTPGGLFFAVPGEKEDGAQYVGQAGAEGCRFVVCERGALAGLMSAHPDLTFCPVDSVRRAIWQLAAARFHAERSPVRVLGLTGTNGKTTCTYLLEELLKKMGHRVGVLGTVSYRWPGHTEPAPLTTPDALSLHSMLAAMEEAGCDYCVMEVSSHAIAQERVYGIPFAGCAFTNLTQDHLDFHRTMESYFAVKRKLFTEVPKPDKICAINTDDPYGRLLADQVGHTVTFGFGEHPADENHLQGTLISSDTTGCHLAMSFRGRTWELRSPLIGAFNAANLLTVQALALGMGCPPEAFRSLASFAGVRGRLERMPVRDSVFVDYAHTPDALANVLRALRDAGFTRIITVFGCGGNRDRLKRPIMGSVVAERSDVCIVTSDNPRYEDPRAIIDDIVPGMTQAREMHVEPDRRQATVLALSMLHGPHDCVVICGKGHEDYQIIQGRRYHYSDQDVVQEYYACN